MAEDLIDEWFLGNIERIEQVVLSRVDQASSEAELKAIQFEEAPDGFNRVSAIFKGRLRDEANERIASAKERVGTAITEKAAKLKK